MYYIQDTTTPKICLPLSLLLAIFYKAHSHDLSGHPGREKTQATITENYFFPNINKWIAKLTQDCLSCQTSKSMPNLLMAPQQPFLEVSPYFNHRISMDTKGPSSPSSDGNFYVYVIVDAFTHYVVLQPLPKIDATNALTVLFVHWVVKFGIPDILVKDNGNEYINGEFTHFCRTYNVEFKPRTPYAPWSNGLVENSNRKLNAFLRTVLDSQYDTLSHKVNIFPFAFNSQVRTNLNLSLYELVFGQKPKKPIMFNLSSTTDSLGNEKPTENSPCNLPPNHTNTDHLGHHPQIKKLQKGTFAHWFLNREKIHSEVYNEVHNYLNQIKHLRTSINRRFGTAQPLKINTYVLIVNKTTQIGVSKKIQPQKIEPYKIIDTPTLVTYKLTDFSGKQITCHRSNIVPYYPKELFVQEQMEKYFSDNSLLKLHPTKPPLNNSNTVSFSLDNLEVPSTNDLPPNHPVTCLRYPKQLRKTTLQQIVAFGDNQ